MKKIVSVLCAVLALAACDNQKSDKPVIKIGVSLPLSGNMQSVAASSRKAVQTAIKDANANADNHYHYDIVIEDDSMQPQQAQLIANKFTTLDKVNAFVSFTSSQGRIFSSFADKYETLHFNCAFGNAGVLTSKYNFQMFTQPDTEVKAVADFLKNTNKKSVTLLFVNRVTSEELVKALVPLLKKYNIKYDTEYFNQTDRDFSILVERVKKQNNDAIVLYGLEPTISIIGKSLYANGLIDKVVMPDVIQFVSDINLYNGAYNIGSAVADKEFKKHINLKKENPAFSNYMYDIVSFIVSAYENTYDKDTDINNSKVADYILSQKNWDGVAGKYNIAPNGAIETDVVLYKIENGKLVKE